MTSGIPAELAAFSTQNASLGASVYYGMGGVARLLSAPRTLGELRAVVAFARTNDLPLAVLGSGSNSVCSDLPFEGVVVSLAALRRWHWLAPRRLHVEAGVTNTEIAEACLEEGASGGHWMYRMPGLLGASVRMNARCYGGEMSQVVESVTTLTTDGRLLTRSGAEVFQGYKSTVLMRAPEIVVSAVLAFGEEEERHTLLARMLACETDRHGKHHFDHPSCGSTFKNNYQVGKPSGRVFDELHLKGTRVGACEVSSHHANFVWNLGGARADDMLTLAALMREKALAAGADLELEVQPVGVFDASLFARCAMERLGPSVDISPAAEPAAEPAGATSKKWVGLTWHPAMTASDSGVDFPLTHLDALPEEYFRAPRNNPAALARMRVRLVQLVPHALAQASPLVPFLRFETRVARAHVAEVFPLAPAAPGGAFVDGLWHHSVSEIFFAHPAWERAGVRTPAQAKARGVAFPYREFEITPAGHWVALAFDGVRTRASESAIPNAALWPGVSATAIPTDGPEEEDVTFSLELTYAAVAPCLENGRVLVQVALSLGGGRYLLAPHWLAAQPDSSSVPGSAPRSTPEAVETSCFGSEPNVAPDFHQPWRGFPLTLL